MKQETTTLMTPKRAEVRQLGEEGGQASGYGGQLQKVGREREEVPWSSNYSVTG